MKRSRFLLIGVISMLVFLFSTLNGCGQATPVEQTFKLETKKDENVVTFYVTIQNGNDKIVLTAIGDIKKGILGVIRKDSNAIVSFAKGKAYGDNLNLFGSKKLPIEGINDEDIMLAKLTGQGYQFSKIIDDAAVRQVFSVFDQLLFRLDPQADGKNATALSYSQEETIKILMFDCPREWKWSTDEQAVGKKSAA